MNTVDVGMLSQEAIDRLSEPGRLVSLTPDPLRWIPVSEVEKKGRILAISWRKGISVQNGRFEGCWSDPTTYTWDEEKQYFACRRRGICIWPQHMADYLCIVLPDLPPARD
jgi:hypothetical protein